MPPTLGRPPTLSIVIPALNEARNLEHVLPLLPEVHQVILIDGGSSDDTIATARATLPGIEVITQTRRGKGNALACGFAAATGDIIIMFDADGSADPTEIDRFVATLLAGADFAKGSRYRPGGGSHDITWLRDTGNRALNLIVNILLGTHYTDLCYGYNAFWRRITPALALPDHTTPTGPHHTVWGDGFEIETVINCRVATAQLTITEVPSIELPRLHGTSNLHTFRDGFRVLRTILNERRTAHRNHRNHRHAINAALHDIHHTPTPKTTHTTTHTQTLAPVTQLRPHTQLRHDIDQLEESL